MVGCVGPASDRMDKIRRVAASCQGISNNVDVKARRPSSILGVLDNDSITSEKSGNDWTDEVMELGRLAIKTAGRCIALQDS